MDIVVAPAHQKNFNTRPPGARVSALVYHDTGGTAASAVAWFQDPTSGVSAHYVVAADGRVYSCVAEDRRAWHAGGSALHGVADLNSWSVGVELEDRDDRADYPKPQMDALLALAADLCARYRVPLNRVVGHEHVALPRGRKVDPGPDFPWYWHLCELGRRLAARGPA